MERPELLRKIRDLSALKAKHLDDIEKLKLDNSQLRRDLYDRVELSKVEIADNKQKIDELTKIHAQNLESLQAKHKKNMEQKDGTIRELSHKMMADRKAVNEVSVRYSSYARRFVSIHG